MDIKLHMMKYVKKYLSGVVSLSLIASMLLPVAASAQTSLQTNLTLIQTLSAQIKTLQEQILGLQNQQTQLQTTSNQAMVEILASMGLGSSGDQVTLLQTLLAADASLYPEGTISGYYGPATRRAIERFQRKMGISAVGSVGPMTRNALNQYIRQQFQVATTVDSSISGNVIAALQGATAPTLSTSSDLCEIPSLPTNGTSIIQRNGKTKIVQMGNLFIYQDGKHKIIITPNTYIEKDGKKQTLITPNMRIDKDGKSRSYISCNGTTTPNPTPTPTPGNDTTAPVISSIASLPTQNAATITWNTNEGATGKVYYGTAGNFNPATSSSASETNVWWWMDSSNNTNHSVKLNSLSASTTYFYVVESKDKKGNTATSSVQSFKTGGTGADVTAPTITAVNISAVGTSSVTLTWVTNENANSKVFFASTTPLNTGTASTKTDGSMVTNHSMTLTLLNPSTTYYFKVQSADTAGNETIASETSFTTMVYVPADVIAPTISATSISNVSSTTAQVTWNTNEAGTTKIYYSTVTPLVLGTALNSATSTLTTGHGVNLTGLTASTTYYIVVESADSSGNTGRGTETSFVTGN